MAFNVKYLTQEEMKRLFNAIQRGGSKRDRAMFKVIYDYSLRASEVGLLRVEDVDLSRRKIMVRRLKSGLDGEKLIKSDTARILTAYLEERDDFYLALFPSRRKRPISRQQLDFLFRRYARKAKLPEDKRHVHTLRHSIATHLLDAGLSIVYVQDHLGHVSIATTAIYARITDKKRDEAFRIMERSNQIVKM